MQKTKSLKQKSRSSPKQESSRKDRVSSKNKGTSKKERVSSRNQESSKQEQKRLKSKQRSKEQVKQGTKSTSNKKKSSDRPSKRTRVQSPAKQSPSKQSSLDHQSQSALATLVPGRDSYPQLCNPPWLTATCLICMTDSPLTKGICCPRFKDGRIHYVCVDCINGYVAQKKKHLVICVNPGCEKSYVDDHLFPLLTKTSYDALRVARLRHLAKTNKNVWFCVSCEEANYTDLKLMDKSTKVKCSKCHTEVCVNCGESFHANLSCEDAALKKRLLLEASLDEETRKVLKEFELSQCPNKCPFTAFQGEACNDTTCPRCNIRYCAVCKLESPKTSHWCRFNKNDDKCKSTDCKHCPRWPKESKDFEIAPTKDGKVPERKARPASSGPQTEATGNTDDDDDQPLPPVLQMLLSLGTISSILETRRQGNSNTMTRLILGSLD